jgi:hypothetical protein
MQHRPQERALKANVRAQQSTGQEEMYRRARELAAAEEQKNKSSSEEKPQVG